jgi:hypothetical protein
MCMFPTNNGPPGISCQSRSNPPKPDIRGQSGSIQDGGFGVREKDEMSEMTTLLKEMVVLLRDMNQRQASLGM